MPDDPGALAMAPAPLAEDRISADDFMVRLAADLASARSMDEVAVVIAAHAGAVVGATLSLFALWSVPDDDVRLVLPMLSEVGLKDRWAQIPIDSATPLTECIRTGDAVHVTSIEEIARRFPSGLDDAKRLGLQSVSAYPIDSGDPNLRAAVGVAWDRPQVDTDHRSLDAMLGLCGAVVDRARSSDDAMRTSALLDTIFREAPIGLGFVSPDMEFVHINDRLAAMNGRAPADHQGRTVEEVVPDLAGQLQPLLRQVMDDGAAMTQVEVTGQTPAQPGEVRTWEEGLFPITVEGDRLVGVGLVVEEVTDRRKAESEQRRIAQQLQSGLLPTRLPQIPGYDISYRYDAADDDVSVGGDWYDVVELGSDDFAVVIGDVVGHDLPAAIAMSQMRNALAGASHVRSEPSAVLCALDDFAQHYPGASLATVFYGRIEPSTGRLTYSSGGHPPPIIVRVDGAIEFLDSATGPPVGMKNDRPRASVYLAPGDILFGYTDGLLEHRSEHIDVGIERLVTSLSAAGVESALDVLIDTVCDEVPHPDRDDDIALLAIRRRSDAGAGDSHS